MNQFTSLIEQLREIFPQLDDPKELNSLEDWEDIDDLIDDYFDVMELPKKEKDKRKDFAKKFNNSVLFIFALITVMREENRIRRVELISKLSDEYRNLLSQYMDIDDYLDEHINEFSNETIDVTLRHEEDFFTSQDRAFLISVNEANTGFNYEQYINAIESGKTRKKWITEKDNRVRKTHRALDEKTIPILNTFSVGKTYMRFPHDTLFSANYEELSNCRCTISYL